ncbi:NAD-dependent epimerase/dehydratase family protein, partial [bacterium]|nr:NAD-dependent epimerase/dehydratase family protein [bacterium]
YSGTTLVTGAAGFMGSHVVEHLAKKGVKVRATARPRNDISFFDNLGVEYVPADLTKPETLPPLFEGDVDRVFHLGAICNLTTPFKELYPTNVAGVEHITTLAMRKKVRCFVHVTSTTVYGQYTGIPFKESANRNPTEDYGKSKKAGEDIVFTQIKKGLPAIILRPCTVYGPRCNDGAGKAFSRPSTISAIPGNGKQLLANIRAEDVAEAIEFLSFKEDTIGEAFNIAENTTPTLEEALTLAAELYKTKVPKLHLPLGIVKATALIDGLISGFKSKIPDLEYNAVKYLYKDYVVDNSKLAETGFQLRFPDFESSMRQLGELYWKTLNK